jgi:hypothetical protein
VGNSCRLYPLHELQVVSHLYAPGGEWGSCTMQKWLPRQLAELQHGLLSPLDFTKLPGCP